MHRSQFRWDSWDLFKKYSEIVLLLKYLRNLKSCVFILKCSFSFVLPELTIIKETSNPYLYVIVDCAHCDSLDVIMPKKEKGFEIEQALD